MDERSDRDLVTASCGGDRTAYAGLVRRHYDHVFVVCLGVLGSIHDAEDVAQDAMLKGFEQIRQLRDGAQFASWVVAIGRNLSINQLRKRKVADKTFHGERPTEQVAPGSGHEDLERAVARLPQDLRAPLVMYYFDGQDVKTVAQRLEVSPSGVYLKLRTAVRRLHKMLTVRGDTP
ncbi:MAG TPA: sigma-70 family RNA polymerase sigma factor [Sedimentisphaerales bacterium]|nr:sigma-70 family RNA polymerase sigma factor [Sedimentisphaerales bacterium]HNU31559.1 sigma-70 family RNA polymerase sigma factor [Sedimentisphaerales bacterium]